MQERTPLLYFETILSIPKLSKVLYCLHLTSKKCRQYSTLFRKVPTVQHFLSGFGVISWEVMQCENAEILFPYCTGPRRMTPKSLKSDSLIGNEGEHADFGTRIFPYW